MRLSLILLGKKTMGRFETGGYRRVSYPDHINVWHPRYNIYTLNTLYLGNFSQILT